jgi:UMF1 family MFS transporter
MPGAMFMGWLADRWGQKKSVLLCIGVYMLWLLFAFFIEARWQFWLMGVVLAFIMGGIQAVSRAIMGLLTPPARSGEFFGFFNLSGKATSFAGPMLFSSILVGTKSPQLAILSLLIFFIVGGALVTRVDVARGQREAQAG